MDPFQLIQRAQVIDPSYRPGPLDALILEAVTDEAPLVIGRHSVSLTLTADASAGPTAFAHAPKAGMYLVCVVGHSYDLVAMASGNIQIETKYTGPSGAERVPFNAMAAISLTAEDEQYTMHPIISVLGGIFTWQYDATAFVGTSVKAVMGWSVLRLC